MNVGNANEVEPRRPRKPSPGWGAAAPVLPRGLWPLALLSPPNNARLSSSSSSKDSPLPSALHKRAPARRPTPGTTHATSWEGPLQDGGPHNPSPCSGGVTGHPRGANQPRGPECCMLEGPAPSRPVRASLPGGGLAGKELGLPGSLEAVVRADRVVPEELLAAVHTRFCTGREEKQRLESHGS